MALLEYFNFYNKLKAAREIAFLNSLFSHYSWLQSYDNYENKKAKIKFIGKLDGILAKNKQRSAFAMYYLNGMAGLSKWIFTEDCQGALENLEKSLKFADFSQRTDKDIMTKGIFRPKKVVLFRYLAKICQKLKKYDKARQYLDEGRQHDPHSYEFPMQEMLLCYEQKNYSKVLKLSDEVEEILNTAERPMPGDLQDLWDRRAHAHTNLKNYAAAIDCFDYLIDKFVDYRSFYQEFKKSVLTRQELEQRKKIGGRADNNCAMPSAGNKKPLLCEM